MEAAWRATAPGGQTNVGGLLPVASTITRDAYPLIFEKRLVGTYLGGVEPARDLPDLARAAADGAISFGGSSKRSPSTTCPWPSNVSALGTVTARLVVTLP